MSISPTHPPLSTVEEDDDPYNPFDDYAESRASLISDTFDTLRDPHTRTSQIEDFVFDYQRTTQSSNVATQAPAGIGQPRPASHVPLRKPLERDLKHRPTYSLDSPRPTPPKRETSWYLEDLEEEAPQPSLVPSHVIEPPTPHNPRYPLERDEGARTPSDDRGRPSQSNSLLPRPRLDRSATSYHTAHDSVSDADPSEIQPRKTSSRPLTMSSRGVSPRPADDTSLRVDVNAPPATALKRSDSKKPKSPLTGFFGWRKSSDNRPDSPTTTISDSRSVSPGPSPSTRDRKGSVIPDARPSSGIIGEQSDYFTGHNSYYGLPSPAPEGQQPMLQAEDLMKELQDISAELAASIRREMELEDENDRLKAELPPLQSEQVERSSDYYSDSGYGSTRLHPTDSEHKIETLERLRRQAEQEKAQLRLDMSNKAQEEMNEKNNLEMRIQSLEDQLRHANHGSTENLKGVEASLEDTKRRLSEERHSKENFEDLLTGMRQEVESFRSERDNLKDEVVPQLRARLEGLESQHADMENMTYENARVQQENQSLKNENQTLANARRLQLDMQQGGGASPRIKSIAEEDEDPGTPRTPNPMGLSRSNSLARSKSTRHRPGSMAMSKDGIAVLADADSVNDGETQRDALHRTLKALILRQEAMTKTHEKQLRKLTRERDGAFLEQRRRTAFYFEIQKQRHDLNHLRRRADDAMEQKWQCEKGLSGLKMDLDRAQQETSSLQELLTQKDILVSDRPSSGESVGVDDEPLDVAFSTLRTLYDTTLSTVQATADTEHPDTNVAALVASSSIRFEALSSQIETQLSANDQLRERLHSTVTRGVDEQQMTGQKITDLETALRASEEHVVTATNVSEEAVAEHEEHIKTMRGANDERQGLMPFSAGSSQQNQGLGLTLTTSQKGKLFSTRAPRLRTTTTGTGVGVAESSKTNELESSVSGLEKVARSSDGEMQALLQSMEKVRLEVGNLQGERDEAIRQTRRLQREILEERERLKALSA